MYLCFMNEEENIVRPEDYLCSYCAEYGIDRKCQCFYHDFLTQTIYPVCKEVEEEENNIIVLTMCTHCVILIT